MCDHNRSKRAFCKKITPRRHEQLFIDINPLRLLIRCFYTSTNIGSRRKNRASCILISVPIFANKLGE